MVVLPIRFAITASESVPSSLTCAGVHAPVFGVQRGGGRVSSRLAASCIGTTDHLINQSKHSVVFVKCHPTLTRCPLVCFLQRSQPLSHSWDSATTSTRSRNTPCS